MLLSEEERRCIAVVRIRGNVNIRRELEYVFKIMHLTRENHATLMDSRPSNLGALQKVKDYATWGEPFQEAIALLLRKRGRLTGNRQLTDDYAKEKLGYDSIEGLAEAIYKCDVDIRKLPDLKPLFRLHPPRGGFREKKRKPYPEGELGYRGETINTLIEKMA